MLVGKMLIIAGSNNLFHFELLSSYSNFDSSFSYFFFFKEIFTLDTNCYFSFFCFFVWNKRRIWKIFDRRLGRVTIEKWMGNHSYSRWFRYDSGWSVLPSFRFERYKLEKKCRKCPSLLRDCGEDILVASHCHARKNGSEGMKRGWHNAGRWKNIDRIGPEYKYKLHADRTFSPICFSH